MHRRGLALLGLVLTVAVAVATAVMLVAARQDDGGGAARVLGQLSDGYRYVRMEPEEVSAVTQLFREGYGATDVAVTLVETPLEQAPLGVAVVVFVLRDPPDPQRLARDLEKDVPLVDPQPKTLAGEPVLSHEADATLSSATLWVHGRLVVVTYASTTSEVDGVMAALLSSGAWRTSGAA